MVALKTEYCQKIKGARSSFFQKYQLPEYYMMFARKILFLLNFGGTCPAAGLPISYAYGVPNILELFLTAMLAVTTVINLYQCM